jgi:hypothetical protein
MPPLFVLFIPPLTRSTYAISVSTPPKKGETWTTPDDLFKMDLPGSLQKVLGALKTAVSIVADGQTPDLDDMDILTVMINANRSAQDQIPKPGYVNRPGVKPGTFPADPENPERVSDLLFPGDCSDPKAVSDAVTDLEKWLLQNSNEFVAACVFPPGCGKSKAVFDTLRRNFGIYLDLTTGHHDASWRQAVTNMDGSIRDFGNRLYRKDNVFELACTNLQDSLRNQIHTVLLARLLVLMKLKEALGTRLTPNIWAIYQTTEAAADAFIDCTAAIRKKQVARDLLETTLRALKIGRFPVFCDEFQVLVAFPKEHNIGEG